MGCDTWAIRPEPWFAGKWLAEDGYVSFLAESRPTISDSTNFCKRPIPDVAPYKNRTFNRDQLDAFGYWITSFARRSFNPRPHA
jgi:hypothetical protein